MTVRGAVLSGRRAAAALRTDRCTITRTGTDGVFDPETGTTTHPETVLFAGQACRVRVPTVADREAFAGQHQFTLADAVLSLPVEVTGLAVGDTVTMTASELDPDLTGRVYTLMAVHRASQITARRCVIREVTA